MTTEAIAEAIKLTAQLQELHGVNPFKVKALANAAYRLDKTNISLEGKSLEELSATKAQGLKEARSCPVILSHFFVKLCGLESLWPRKSITGRKASTLYRQQFSDKMLLSSRTAMMC